ncbi:cytochrome C oxidase subunit IV family protein [Pseudomonas schmalbachii]|uniref:Cytochrome C oxidase subunit IV family protein n=1 Tax=Pseudomonas schmalbachii TaxID=2816993 RepID=A0ABS3TWB9_9PSED|nr:cytochrome C oxidase subunit IV family protein [Pseudomonas schmalbachii]MBO3277938.1 cytochrome C oxidase subunit IV family protein [Pseudomonas schmalbachii]
MRALFSCWIVLLLLTLVSVSCGSHGERWAMGLVLGCGVAKGWLISERFMELHSAPRLWRILLLAWPLLLALLVGMTLWPGLRE